MSLFHYRYELLWYQTGSNYDKRFTLTNALFDSCGRMEKYAAGCRPVSPVGHAARSQLQTDPHDVAEILPAMIRTAPENCEIPAGKHRFRPHKTRVRQPSHHHSRQIQAAF